MLHNNLALKAIDWNTAIYVRISEKERIKSLGDSITNQKQILKIHAEKNDLNVIKIFTDEGQKGGNFNRPAFKTMIKAIEDGTINCVLVKDLSRFGREHIEGDYYLEKMFPSKGVRFISLIERIDSVADPERMNSIEIPIINLFNEQYLRQVSNSTKASLMIKRKEGKYVTPIVPYGYLRSSEDKYKLIADEYAKPIVEDIFKHYLNYVSINEIAKMIDDKEILNPVSYRRELKGESINTDSHWSNTTIRNILTNPIYTGDMVQGRTKSYSHKVNKRIPLPKDQWDIVPDTHEPIIEKDNFEMVQSLIKYQARPTRRKHNTKPSILAGFLVCSDCGKKMQRRITTVEEKSYYNFSCSTYKKLGKYICSSHLVREDVILEVLLITINTIIQSMVDVEQSIINNQKNDINRMVAKLNHEIYRINVEIEKADKIKAGLYSDYKMDIISLSDYNGMKKRFGDKVILLKKKAKKIEEQVKGISCDSGLNSNAVKLFKLYEGIGKLDREIIGALVNKIVVDHERNITIHFKFQDEIKKYISFNDN